MRISHECVYQFAYSELGEELELKKFLLRAHKRRKKKTGRSVRKVSNIPDRRDISERPASVLEREEFGHFEGDSVLSVRPSKSAFRTEVERASRFLMAEKVLRKTAECALSAATRMYRGLPEGAVKSVTYDNGCEHSRHAELSAALGGVPVYFAKPYHSWERGTNEHANGMLRRFFPKGADFDLVTDEELRAAVDAINDTPRKILRYRTAREAFHEYLSTFS